jgi:hypothetical protein
MAGLDPAIQEPKRKILRLILDDRRHAEGMLRMRGRP